MTTSVDTSALGERISTGLASEVYRWDEDAVLKLYRPGVPVEPVVEEMEKTRMVAAAGIAVAKPRDSVALAGRYGIVFREVPGVTLLDALMQRPAKVEELAHLFAEIQSGLHQTRVSSLPALKQQLGHRIQAAEGVPMEIRRAAHAKVAALPDEEWLCHGDFQPLNLLLNTEGAVVVDWFDAAKGHPGVDLARTELLLSHGDMPVGLSAESVATLRALRERFVDCWRSRYRQLSQRNIDPDQWKLPVAVARLAEATSPAERGALLDLLSRLPVD